MGESIKKSQGYHGGCKAYRYKQTDKSVSIQLSFDDANRLALALQSGLLELNTYNRNRMDGKRMGVELSIKTPSNAPGPHSIAVWARKLTKPVEARQEVGNRPTSAQLDAII